MPLYGCQPPTGYADRADAWVNTGALLNRMNFAVTLTRGGSLGAARFRTDDPRGLVSAEIVQREVLAGEPFRRHDGNHRAGHGPGTGARAAARFARVPEEVKR